MPITLPLFRSEDLLDPRKIEQHSKELFDQAEDGSSGLKQNISKEIAYFFQNKWIGLPVYAQAYAGDWAKTEAFLIALQEDFERCQTLEEATEAALTHLRRFGRQTAADFVGAFCFLEAQAKEQGGNDEIIRQVRAAEQAYAGYLAEKEHLLSGIPANEVKPGEALYLAHPLFEHAPGFMQWLFGVIDVALLNRRDILQEALVAQDFNQLLLRMQLATSGVVEDACLFAAYYALVLDLPKFYSISAVHA